MKSLIVSDCHFGSFHGQDLLGYEFARKLLRPYIKEVDEVILNGDILELSFQRLENSVEASLPFFAMLREEMQGGRVVYIVGNHDHHLIIRDLEDSLETKLATGLSDEELSKLPRHKGFLERFLEHQLPGVEVEVAYPTYDCRGVLVTHGHYMDAHIKGSIPSLLLQRTAWKISGGKRGQKLTVEDYEALSTPLWEFYHHIAQLPRGLAAQAAIWEQAQLIGRFIKVTSLIGKGTSKAAKWTASKVGSALKRKNYENMIAPVGEFATLDESELQILEALQAVKNNLEWSAKKIVTAHTHQPIVAAKIPGDETEYYNCGSWFYDEKNAKKKTYLERAWPGNIILIDDVGNVELVNLLGEYNPLTLQKQIQAMNS